MILRRGAWTEGSDWASDGNERQEYEVTLKQRICAKRRRLWTVGNFETEENSKAALEEKSKLGARGDDSTVWAGVKGLKWRVCKEQKWVE